MKTISSRAGWSMDIKYDGRDIAKAMLTLDKCFQALHTAPHKHLPVPPTGGVLGAAPAPTIDTFYLLTTAERQALIDDLAMVYLILENPNV